MNLLTFIIVLALVTVVGLLSFIAGWTVGGTRTVKNLKDKGWTIKPPEAAENA